MKKLISTLLFSTILTPAFSVTTNVAMMSAAVVASSAAASTAIQNSHRAESQNRDVSPITALIGKKIENCLILNAFWDSYNRDFYVVCPNSEKDAIYSKAIYNPERPFQKKIYDELRKSFKNAEITTESDTAE